MKSYFIYCNIIWLDIQATLTFILFFARNITTGGVMKKEFWKYVIPSMISSLVGGIYVSIDGLFVGRAVGDLGIAAINIAWPIAAIILAIGTGIGMGGAINISNHLGAGRKDKADKSLGNTLSLLLIASLILTISTLVFAKPLLIIMGAQGEILDLGFRYIRVIGLGAILQVMGTGVTPLLRNQNKSWLAMVLMISNFAIDTILSGVFVMVLGHGVTGAAAASLIGQTFALIPSLFILFKKENRVSLTNYLLDMKLVQSIFKVGVSPFGLSFIPSLTIVIINWQAQKIGGTTAIAAYAVISYILSAGQLLLQGIGDGSQPLISFYNGANNLSAVNRLRKWTYEISCITGILVMGGIILLTYQIPVLFGVSKETAIILHTALPLCGISLPLFALTRVASAYFYAIKESLKASLLIYSEVMVILPICVLLLPILFELTGLWLALVVTQLLLLIFSLILTGSKKIPIREIG